KGDRVILWGENSPEWVAAFFGCLLRGAIVVPLDAASAPDFAARVQTQVGAKLLLYGDVEAEELAGTLPALRLSQFSETVSRHSDAHYRNVDIAAADIAEIIYTSGTTAEPKGVVLTHQNLLANLAPLERGMEKYLKWERLVRPLRFLCLVPLSHVFGQFMGMFVPQLVGGEVFFQESLKPSDIVETTKRERVSVIVAVPRLLDTLREKIERDAGAPAQREKFRRQLEDAARWGTLRRWLSFRKVHRSFGWKFWAFVVGGATLDDETETFWRRLGYGVVQGYGMTETASLVSVNHPFKPGRGSIGRTLPGQEIKIGENGEIMVRGANVSPGYWDGGAVRAIGDSEGWLRTGDVAEMDAGGKLYFKGRRKDVIVTGAGLNVHPEDLEAALNHQRVVRASAVVGFEGARGMEALAVIVLRDESADVEAIIRRANERLARHQQIRRWLVWHESDLPRTPTQKVLRREVAEIARARLAAQDDAEEETIASVSSSNALAELVARVGGDVKSARLSASMSLATDLNLDSLGRVELLGALEDRYQLEIDEAAFTAATTLGDVQQLIAHGASEGWREDEGQARAPYPYPRWAQRFPATWIRIVLLSTIVIPLVRLMSPLRVVGRERLARLGDSPVLFVANHVTRADQALVLAALPGRFARRLAVAMEGELLRDWRHASAGTGLIMRLRGLAQYALVVAFFNVFPLPKKSGFRRSFAFAGEALDRGFILLVFPEGVRAKDGHMNPFMAGTGLLVKELGVPVVPVRLEGLYKLKREGRRIALPGEVTLRFGDPVKFGDEDATEIAKELERRVATL
ncbi:MAG: long-chain acyl-CoA synthetase, partial [Acidobacteriota bacterium]|nr:long-chain acyl-CoA synthetase [Acidobacteriota bacterium]